MTESLPDWSDTSIPTSPSPPNGRVDVAWWDFRNERGNFANDVYMTSSGDNATTWSPNLRVTDRSVSRRIGVWYGNSDIRQAPGLASTKDFTVVAWDDTRNGDDTTQSQDIYSAVAQFSAVAPGTPRTAQYGLAIASGVAALGLVLLVLASMRRRRSAGMPGAEPTARAKIATPAPEP